jgi:hypothetical protein
MADMYTPEQLSQVYGNWNPMAYTMGQGQAEQLQQQNKQQFAEESQKRNLANMFDAQNNPMKLESSRLGNEGEAFKNQSLGVKARNDVALEPLVLSDSKRKMAIAASEDEVKGMGLQAQQWMMSGDPALVAKGEKLHSMSQAVVDERQKHAYEMEKQQVIRASAEKVAGIHAGATLGAARIGADSRMSVAKARQGLDKTVDQQLMGAKSSDQRVGVYETAARQAQLQGDDQQAQYYADMANRNRQGILDARAAGANAIQDGKADISKLGIATNPTVVPQSTRPLPGMGSQPQPQAPSGAPAVGTVSKGYVFLGGNPSSKESWRKQ